MCVFQKRNSEFSASLESIELSAFSAIKLVSASAGQLTTTLSHLTC